VDVASLYNGVQKYLKLLLFKLIVNDVKIACLSQFDPRNFTFLAFMNFLPRERIEKRRNVMFENVTSIPSSKVMSHPKELRKEALIVYCVHNHAFSSFIICP
jgi:hypothetical protein